MAFPTYPLIMGFKGTEFEVVNFYERAAAKFPPGLPKIGITPCPTKANKCLPSYMTSTSNVLRIACLPYIHVSTRMAADLL